jgi:hypothetical protein
MSSIPARLSSLPDDVPRALATFVALSDLLVLVRCSHHFQMVLQRELNRRLDRLFVITHVKEHCVEARRLPFTLIPYQPEQCVLHALFGEADVLEDSRAYFFTDGQSILSLIQHKYMSGNASYYIMSGEDKPVRDRFASWLWYRCEQQIATEAHMYGNTTEITCGNTSDL